MGKDADREKRLAEALRANLRRRKDKLRAAAASASGDERPAEEYEHQPPER